VCSRLFWFGGTLSLAVSKPNENQKNLRYAFACCKSAGVLAMSSCYAAFWSVSLWLIGERKFESATADMTIMVRGKWGQTRQTPFSWA
jgi:hypothetical protein